MENLFNFLGGGGGGAAAPRGGGGAGAPGRGGRGPGNPFGIPVPQGVGHRHRRMAMYHDLLRAYPAYSIGRFDLEKGNKVLLPPSALNQLAAQHVPNPMLFCINNTILNKQTMVGVLEFIADEGAIILPNWIFYNLSLMEGQEITIGLNTEIPRAKFVKIQPHETAFIEIPDPRAVLEFQLRNYTCLTKDDTINIEFMNKTYRLDILEVKPDNDFKCVCTIDADLDLDFAPPLDFKEKLPELGKKSSSLILNEESKEQKGDAFLPFKGDGVRMDGKKPVPVKVDEKAKPAAAQEEYDPRKHRLNNGVKTTIQKPQFSGSGTKLGETPFKK